MPRVENKLQLRFPFLKFVPGLGISSAHEVDFCLEIKREHDPKCHVIKANPVALILAYFFFDHALGEVGEILKRVVDMELAMPGNAGFDYPSPPTAKLFSSNQ
jgi:hypothetical protein